MAEFTTFFDTKIGQESIMLFGEKQQQHEIILTNEVEYFQLDEKIQPCLAHIQGIKACDYVLVNHKNKEIVLCELKNHRQGGFVPEAMQQLEHSRHLIDFFLKILKSQPYQYASLILSKRPMNKKPTRHHVKYKITSQKSIHWEALTYA